MFATIDMNINVYVFELHIFEGFLLHSPEGANPG